MSAPDDTADVVAAELASAPQNSPLDAAELASTPPNSPRRRQTRLDAAELALSPPLPLERKERAVAFDIPPAISSSVTSLTSFVNGDN